MEQHLRRAQSGCRHARSKDKKQRRGTGCKKDSRHLHDDRVPVVDGRHERRGPARVGEVDSRVARE